MLAALPPGSSSLCRRHLIAELKLCKGHVNFTRTAAALFSRHLIIHCFGKQGRSAPHYVVRLVVVRCVYYKVNKFANNFLPVPRQPPGGLELSSLDNVVVAMLQQAPHDLRTAAQPSLKFKAEPEPGGMAPKDNLLLGSSNLSTLPRWWLWHLPSANDKVSKNTCAY